MVFQEEAWQVVSPRSTGSVHLRPNDITMKCRSILAHPLGQRNVRELATMATMASTQPGSDTYHDVSQNVKGR